MNNLLSYFGLTDARMRASEKDLPVQSRFLFIKNCGILKEIQLKNQFSVFLVFIGMVITFFLDQHDHIWIHHTLRNCLPWIIVYGHGSFCWANVFTFGMWPKTFQGQQ